METWILPVADCTLEFGMYPIHDACVLLSTLFGTACMGAAWYFIHKVPFL